MCPPPLCVSVRWVTLWVRPPPLYVLRCKTTFCGRRPSVEHILQWKMTLGGRRTLVEDELRWKTTFGGRRPLVEDYLQWKTTFGWTTCGRRRLSLQDNLRWKMPFGGRKPLVEQDIQWILACCLLRFAAFFNCLIINVLFEVFRTNICIQAGAELCQAQQSLSYLLAGS